MVNINWTILWEVFNFLVLLWLLKRYLYGPVKQILEKRSEKIGNDLDHAEKKRQEAVELKEKYEAELRKARKKAQSIIDDAEVRGNKKAKEIIAAAREEAERIKESKLKEIVQAKKEALNELRNETGAMSILIASKILKENLDRNRHEALISQYINELDKKKLSDLQ